MNEKVNSIWTLDQLRTYRVQILALAEAYDAMDVRIFGSVARGDAHPDSEIDFLVKFKQGASLFELSSLWQSLEELLNCRVNVLSEDGLKDQFRQHIENDLIAL